ncbi:MAG: hypothetical protein SFX73_12070 [Kofleriaceae bacterium]|nr:hypothetical protein [Kofleriaceae bacterium]
MNLHHLLPQFGLDVLDPGLYLRDTLALSTNSNNASILAARLGRIAVGVVAWGRVEVRVAAAVLMPP